jgi:hypothetical protein
MPLANRLHDSDFLRRGATALVIAPVWAAFAAVVVAATVYDVGFWLGIW